MKCLHLSYINSRVLFCGKPWGIFADCTLPVRIICKCCCQCMRFGLDNFRTAGCQYHLKVCYLCSTHMMLNAPLELREVGSPEVPSSVATGVQKWCCPLCVSLEKPPSLEWKLGCKERKNLMSLFSSHSPWLSFWIRKLNLAVFSICA